MTELITDKRLDKILLENTNNCIEKSKVGYNLFTLSSYNNQLENFHSDVLASFLDTEGLHGEGRLFLDEFISYLNINCKLKIDSTTFQEPIVKREQGRLDILVFDKSSKNAIIFENKINNAPDMDEQLIRYYDWCECNKLTTVAILYVSLRGLKKAPPVMGEMQDLVNNIATFSDSDSDLVNGWLSKCIDKCRNIETKSLLIQYLKLIKHLAFDSMEKITMDEFYKIANEAGFLKKVRELGELTSKIPVYRADKFQNSIEDYKPFKRTYRYKPNYILFEDYWEGENKYKLDIAFEEDGCAWIGLWNPQQQNEKGNASLLNKVEQISYLSKLQANEDNSWFTKRFDMKEYESMNEIDSRIIEFTKELMRILNQNITNKYSPVTNTP